MAAEYIFAVIGGVSFMLLLLSFALGDFFDMDNEIDVGDVDIPSWYSLKVILAAGVAFGAGGVIATSQDLPLHVSVIIAASTAVVVGAGTFFLVLQPLARQQSNSMVSRETYQGIEAVVTLMITPINWGEVRFVDASGAQVSQRAYLANGMVNALPRGTRVLIQTVNSDSVIVTTVNPTERENPA